MMVSGTALSAPCPHPYFPMENGLKLTYRAGKSQFQLGFQQVVGTGDKQDGKLDVSYGDKKGQTDATCNQDGVKTGLGGIEATALSATGLDVKVLKSEGVVMPPAESLVEGGSWTNTLTFELRAPKSVNLGPLSPVMTTTFVKKATVVGVEEVSVAAGTFKAIKVKNLTTASAGIPGTERTLESYMWIAPRVGIVKIMTKDSVDLELMQVERAATASRELAPNKAN
jgi:hypothetical protein